LNQRWTEQLTADLKAEYFEVGTGGGRSYVGVKFEERLPDGRVREYRTDLEHLESIETQASTYAESGSRRERFEQSGDTHVRLKRGDSPDVVVQLLQKARDGSDEWQGLKTDAATLKTAVERGEEFAKELGQEKKWHVLVNANSLDKDESGRVFAQAVRSFENEEKAREHLGKSTGLALYSVPQRHAFQDGERIELWSDASLTAKGSEPVRSVGRQLARVTFSEERRSEHYVVARWNDASIEPVIGQRVTWEGPGHAYNGEPQDYRAGPISGRDRGRDDEPLWVLIEKGEGRGSKGRIVGVSNERLTMTQERSRLETSVQEVTRDWEKQSFGLDRKEFTQGYSM